MGARAVSHRAHTRLRSRTAASTWAAQHRWKAAWSCPREVFESVERKKRKRGTILRIGVVVMVGGTNSWWASDPSVRGELSGGRVRRAGGAGRRVRHCVGARPSRGRACDGDAVVLWGVSEVHQRMFVAGVSVDANSPYGCVVVPNGLS